jgi:hypothetical protein
MKTVYHHHSAMRATSQSCYRPTTLDVHFYEGKGAWATWAPAPDNQSFMATPPELLWEDA